MSGTCEYLHMMRRITVTKTKQGAFREEVRNFVKNTEPVVFTYEIINGEKCYNGAGGGFCDEDYINPVKLYAMGKICDLNKDEDDNEKVKEGDIEIKDEECFSISDIDEDDF